MEDVAKNYPDVTLEHMLVDNCAMQLVRDPKQLDVDPYRKHAWRYPLMSEVW